MVLFLNYNHLIYLINIINMFEPILSNIHYEMRQYSFLNEITIKIIGIDTQNILYENYKFHPNETYVQGNPYIIDEKNRIMNLTNNENYITMKWNYKLTDCMHMFNGLLNIIEIDLTNFDLSEVTAMNLMFKNCNNLEYSFYQVYRPQKVRFIKNLRELHLFFIILNLNELNESLIII